MVGEGVEVKKKVRKLDFVEQNVARWNERLHILCLRYEDTSH
jgi:hypothetical protein